MSSIFLWGGLTCVVALGALGVPYMTIVGAILMCIGFVLLVVEKR